MKKISIDELIGMVDSSYSLVTIVSKRARQIVDGSDVLIKTSTIKPVSIAIEEFYDNKFQAIYDYDQYKIDLQDSLVMNKQPAEVEIDAKDTEAEQPNK